MDGRALLLIGTVGSGKTTVARAIADELTAQGDTYALLDLDWLCWAGPAAELRLPVHELLVENLRAVLPVLRRAGVRSLVLTRHLVELERLEALRSALDVPLVVVRLDAPRGELERRLRARDTGDDLAEHLDELRRPPTDELADHVVQNAGRPPAATARAVLVAAGW